MSKLRSDSQWNRLSVEQRETLESWLFDENISYREALERMQQEFGIKGSMGGLSRLYQRLANERSEAELLQVCRTAKEMEDKPVDLDQLNKAAITLITKRLIKLAIERPEKVRELATLARVIISNEAVEVKKQWVTLAQDKYDRELKEKREHNEYLLGIRDRALKNLGITPPWETSETEKQTEPRS